MAEIHPAIVPGNLAVITGAADGIGRAAACRLAGLGMRVALVDRDGDKLAALAAELEPHATAFTVDVSDRTAMEQLAARIAAELGSVSVLMSNAGIGGGGDIFADPAVWDSVIAVNLMGMVHAAQCFVPAMAGSGAPGLVINTGSKQGITQPPGNTAYNVSKSGVKSLTEGLAHSLRQKDGCRVSAHLLIPGFTYTGMMQRFIAEQPPAAWTPDQVIDVMLDGVARGDFYLWCLDNETTREVDERRIQWTAEDMVRNRPALSRWHPDYKDEFAAFVAKP